jgi:hypothetical protein
MIRNRILAGLFLASVATAAVAATPAEIETAFKQAMAAARDGRTDLAIERLRALARETRAPRIRLELGRLLLRSGDNAGALAQFREVYLEEGTPQAVRRNILPFLEEAELRQLRIRFGLRAITDSNPSQVSEGGTIYFNGVPMEYEPPARKETAYGIEPWLSAEKLWQNGYLTKFNASARLFEEEDLLRGRFQVAAGKRIASVPGLFVQAGIETEIASHGSYILPSVESWRRFRLSDTASIGLGGQAGYMVSETDGASGQFYRGYIFGDWTFQPNATVFGRMSAETLDSRDDFYSYVSTKLDVGLDFGTTDLRITPQLSWKQTRFLEYSPFWGNRRDDTTIRPEITLSSERIEWDGIRPELSIFYESRTSNVEIYEYDQLGGYVNLRKLF